MKADSKRWTQISASRFAHEKEALDHLREALPDQEPYRAFTNLEFIAADGSINEVDALVLTRKGLFLVEIKSGGGSLSGDAGTWCWKSDRRERFADNPLFLANQKAKKLKSLLQAQKALAKLPLPYVHAVVFCSARDLSVKLSPEGRTLVFGRDDRTELPGIGRYLTETRPEELSDSRFRTVDASLARAISRAVEEAGIRPSQRLRRVGSYVLGDLLLQGKHFQDFVGTHDTLPNEHRRVRIYGVPSAEPLARDAIARAAKREYQLLASVEHPGILRALDYVPHDLGPALLFEHTPGAVRLDHFLAEKEKGLDLWVRLRILRQVAEALQNAHEHRLYHRALGPQSLLVLDPEAPEPKVRIFNWQTGLREGSSASSRGVTGTEHITELVEDGAGAYIAPEAGSAPDEDGPLLDVFSLGALAYRLLSGSPPAESASALRNVLSAGGGLNLAAAADGVSESLRTLVRSSTHPEVTHRLGSVSEFLEGLDAAEDELTRPSDGSVANPDTAGPKDRLPKGFTVVRRLGTGSTAVAFLVNRDGEKRPLVLKLALNAGLNDRLRAEAAVLDDLRFPGIVRRVEVVEMYGRAGLVLEQAGDLTLAQRLRVDGRLPLDLLQRWGEDLLKAVAYLEEKGVPHRDLKPDNLGIARTGKDDALHLVLFDFSLSRAPLEAIHAGTRPYLEPFLAERKPRRWDLAAERWAAAVTLHEMATGSHPVWGDGRSDPAALACEATIDADHLEPSVKEPLGAFFEKAFRRSPRERFDNAQEMLWAWQRAFADAARPAVTTGHDEIVDVGALVSAAKLESPLAEVGLSPNALSALDRAGITLVRDLLALPQKRLAHLRGAGSRTRRQLVEVAALLRARFPESTALPEPEPLPDADLPEAFSLDALVAQLLPKKTRKDATTEPRLLRLTLGLDPPSKVKAAAWLAQNDVAREIGISAPQVSRTLSKARERWLRNRNVTLARDDVAEALRASGGVLAVEEMESLLLAARGSAEEEPFRTRHARAVARAASETEKGMKEPRWLLHRAGDRSLLSLSDELASWAERLGNKADQLALLDPLPSPQRVLEALQALPAPASPPNVEPLSGARLVRLAASASTRATVSSRLELYPRGLSAGRALKLAAGAVLSAASLTPEQLQERVRARYPEAEPLPPRPALDALLAEAGLELRWVPGDGVRPGGFSQPTIHVEGLSSETVSQTVAPRGALGAEHPAAPADADAAAFDARLRRTAESGGYLVLMATPRHLPRVEAALCARYDATSVSVEAELLREMKDAARQAGADWTVVLEADAASPGTTDWTNLRSLVGLALPKVEERLDNAPSPVLLTWPGLLVRYDRLDLLDRLRDRHTRAGASGAAWLLVAADEQSELPVLDGKPLPVLSPAQYARVPHAWLEATEGM